MCATACRLCASDTQPTQASPKHTCVQERNKRYTNMFNTKPPHRPQDKPNAPHRSHPGTKQNADAKLVNFYVWSICVNLCQFVSFDDIGSVCEHISSWCLKLCLRSTHGHERARGPDGVVPSGASDSQLCQGAWPDPCDTRGAHHTVWRWAVHNVLLQRLLMIAKWPHSCCSSCHHTQLGAARRRLRCRANERFGQDHHYCSTR